MNRFEGSTILKFYFQESLKETEGGFERVERNVPRIFNI